MKERLILPAGLRGAGMLVRGEMLTRASHRHDELEFNLVTRGLGSYVLTSRKYRLGPGSLVWLFPDQEHVLLETSSDFAMWVFVFRPGLVRNSCPVESSAGLLRKRNPSGWFVKQIPPDAAARLDGLCGQVHACEEDPVMHDAGIAWLLRMAWRTWEAAGWEFRYDDVHPAVEKAAIFLRRDPTLTLPVLAKQAGLSPSRLSRLFKRELGRTVVAFRNEVRIQRFLSAYGAGRRRTMLDCAYEAGFGSYEQFHRVFRQVMGCPPSAYVREGEIDPDAKYT